MAKAITPKDCLSYNGIPLMANNYINWPVETKELAAQEIFKILRTDGFPYFNYSLSELGFDFNKLKYANPILDSNKNLINVKDAGKAIFQHFSPHFYSVRTEKLPSIIEAFNNDVLLMESIRNRMGITYKETFNFTKQTAVQGLRHANLAYHASLFLPTVAKFFYDRFCPSNGIVLDCSAGFGQRMLGAVASARVAKYIGIDPWTTTIEAIQNMADFVKESHRVELHNMGSEFINLPENSVDFALSSPPYYKKEIYSEDTSQAYSGKGKEEFFDLWWKPTIANIEKALKPGGLFVLNMDKNLFGVMKLYTKMKHIDTYQIVKAAKHRTTNIVSNDFYILENV